MLSVVIRSSLIVSLSSLSAEHPPYLDIRLVESYPLVTSLHSLSDLWTEYALRKDCDDCGIELVDL